MANNKEESNAAIIGISLAALAAAAAGTYYFYGSKKAPQHRRKFKSWMLRMKADVMEEIENLKDLNQEMYEQTINKISEKYKLLKDIDPAEVATLAIKMKDHWKDIQKDISEATSSKKRATNSRKTSKRSSRKKKAN